MPVILLIINVPVPLKLGGGVLGGVYGLWMNLTDEILLARQRVYGIGDRTPLEVIGTETGNGALWVKREDLSPIRAYKWRGAFNKMAKLSEEERSRGVVAASAGNHAQGVALGAARLGIKARIFMPVPTPRLKQEAVRRHGGEAVEIILTGDTFHEAAEAAERQVREFGQIMIHPFDDLDVIAGQGTIADEIILSGKGPFDVVFLQIGGGGMAAGVSFWLKKFFPDIRVIGVEGVDQASMKLALDGGEVKPLEYVDVFCDGTAVREAGKLTYDICSETLDEIVTVTNEEVCAGIEFLWNKLRVIPETSGAMGVAAWLKDRKRFENLSSLSILCGANMDFARLGWIVRHAGIGSARRVYYRFTILEVPGTLFRLLELVRSKANIIEFQYGKEGPSQAYPVIGFDADGANLSELQRELNASGIAYLDVTGQPEVEFRIIPWNPTIMESPVFMEVEFPERAGALSDFLNSFYRDVNICYFSYQYSGERVGRAMIGFEIVDSAVRGDIENWKKKVPLGLRALKLVDLPGIGSC